MKMIQISTWKDMFFIFDEIKWFKKKKKKNKVCKRMQQVPVIKRAVFLFSMLSLNMNL